MTFPERQTRKTIEASDARSVLDESARRDRAAINRQMATSQIDARISLIDRLLAGDPAALAMVGGAR